MHYCHIMLKLYKAVNNGCKVFVKLAQCDEIQFSPLKKCEVKWHLHFNEICGKLVGLG
jgi:hypothetical protein